ncbi:hypothetical protein T03_10337, partial [Trichinella britovi]
LIRTKDRGIQDVHKRKQSLNNLVFKVTRQH